MNFYKSAALALDYLEKNQGSVKGSLAATGVKSTAGEAKRILAYKPVLFKILTTVPLQSLEKLTFPRKSPRGTPSSQSLLLVLLHDLLFSPKGKIEASDKWAPKPAVMKHQARLKAELVKIQIKEGKTRKEDLARTAGDGAGADEVVRYVRFNPNAGRSIKQLFQYLESPSPDAKGKGKSAGKGMERLQDAVYPVPQGKYFLDPHLDDVLLAFPGNTTWWLKDDWYENGGIILQDKASCMPAKVLMEGWRDGEGECIDATAAPGNKTSYISALMHNKGKLYAFERSPNRFKTLERMLQKAHCKNVDAQRADFLESDPRDELYGNVTRILLDPSCSGSGIVNRLDYLLEDDVVEETDAKAERLEKLAAFQLQMIQHAFKFTAAKRIVYSTCSIHAEEDERVVLSALKSGIAKERGWALAPRDSVIPSWERRGRPEEMGGDDDLAQGVIRCLPEDKTNGFFVACFVRDDPTGLRPSAKSKAKAKANATLQTSHNDGSKVKDEAQGAKDKSKGKKRARTDEEGDEDTRRPSMGTEITQDGNEVEVDRSEVKEDEVTAQAHDAGKDDGAGDGDDDDTLMKEPKEKTMAQIERNKRKKAAQKAKAKKRKVE
ncbi:nuclear protein [Kwoniella heveanensis BCC8398]|uniref:Nuclear protein n=1 Tax=Kwoniella heveanensis BCC8398 TaxID=1296120 RepID=A0A1B9H3U3_9TREE|nr:nuclear protein [Kwoniella heveanensis BCC8398]